MDTKTTDSGYGIVIRAAMRCKSISCGAKAVYAYLCSFSGYEGVCFPSQKLIAGELNLNICTLRKYLKELIDHDLIKTGKERSGKGKFDRTVYEINYNYAVCSSAMHGPAVHGPAMHGQIDTNINNINNNNYNINNYKNNNINIPENCMKETSSEECRLIEQQFMKSYLE